ncbi:hypothetical protein NW768_003172 [Fusarium equiseti]|uniref:Uncharacterized protein n=1 Tax=Fusarium equiseti TaxID=61235 RepID=A0ABQ8RL41_FUSEQ|nr:hypothetical protein NW768_003172 [Fusarium equiseti]
MCQHYINEYESCHHNKLDRKDQCWQNLIETHFSFLASCLYPPGSHKDVRLFNPVHGMCDACNKRNQQSTRRNYGGFTAQSTHGVGTSRGMEQVQASINPWRQIQPSDYSCGGLNEPPMRSPENSYQPQAYPTQGHQPQAQADNPSQPHKTLGSRALVSGDAPRSGYGYARALHYQRFVSQPARQVSHGPDGIELTNLQPSNLRHSNRNAFANSNGFINSSDPTPYEIQATVGSRDSILSENGRSPARRTLTPIPSPHELEYSLNNSDSVDSLSAAAKKTTRVRTRRRPRKFGTRGNLDIMDRLPRPAPEPGHCERIPVPSRVATLRREHGSSIDRSQTVSPLTESDLRAPFVPIPLYDEYPEYNQDNNYPAQI